MKNCYKTYTFKGSELSFEWHPYDRDLHPYFFIEGFSFWTRSAHFCGLSECASMVCLRDASVNECFSALNI